jgi:hypothetical protein
MAAIVRRLTADVRPFGALDSLAGMSLPARTVIEASARR